jgi:hypothetical protein
LNVGPRLAIGGPIGFIGGIDGHLMAQIGGKCREAIYRRGCLEDLVRKLERIYPDMKAPSSRDVAIARPP